MIVGETRINFMSLNATSSPLPACLGSGGGLKRPTFNGSDLNLLVPALVPRLGNFI